ncbi:HNH endonuclease family protein [Ralstonia insidiosa]|uniref:HNH endonuclease family protein n=1 Tax=Ralstonia insidiosa TaxID=190721 RepID=A0AAC9FSD6_9RALS|nr:MULTISPECIES: HNH endonuclease [Ralstonia]ANH74872.1 HNH endonuclease family protein [Ralstonia insidiosa]MBY4707439.1 hypothetical protein [Ralstonia insidiosa]GAQ28262.1 hypothetical protein SAMD00023378_1945 [Ralstonia sp. NT80]
MKCVYCAEIISVGSLEHVLPQCLGGDFAPKELQTQHCCKGCNSLLGRYVDRIFRRNWFISNFLAISGHAYLESDTPRPIPLVYLGPTNEFSSEADEDVCEVWLGPCGEQVLHFRPRDASDDFLGVAGGDPVRARKESSVAYVSLTTVEPFWLEVTLRSIVDHFKKYKKVRKFLLSTPGDDATRHAMERLGFDFPTRADSRFEFIRDRVFAPGRQGSGKITWDVNFERRFLAKLALGLGVCSGGDRYVESSYADKLRAVLWRKDETAAAPELLGYSDMLASTSPKEPWQELISLPNAITLTTALSEQSFGYHLSLGGKHLGGLQISDDPDLFPRPDGEPASQPVYVSVPSLNTVVTLPLHELIAHKTGNYRHPQLTWLESVAARSACLPPKRPGISGVGPSH